MATEDRDARSAVVEDSIDVYWRDIKDSQPLSRKREFELTGYPLDASDLCM